MRKIACKRCPDCGLYSGIMVQTCRCGRDMTQVPGLLADNPIPPEQCGEMDEQVEFYVQKCSACGAVNVTSTADQPVKICFNCHKTRISSIVPVLYTEEPEETLDDGEDQDMADEEGESDPLWEEILGNIQGIGLEEEEQEEAGQEKNLTLTSIQYEGCTFTLKAAEAITPLMLGRSAYQAEFLSRDLRVGNEHCRIDYRDGNWYVADNHSANGTAINQKDLGLDGESILRDGDELMLGHHPDSMRFQVSIK